MLTSSLARASLITSFKRLYNLAMQYITKHTNNTIKPKMTIPKIEAINTSISHSKTIKSLIQLDKNIIAISAKIGTYNN